MSLSGSFYNYPTSSFGLYCEWSGSQNITGNYTNITLKVYLSYYTIDVSERFDATVSINGTSETYTTSSINDYSSGLKKKLLKTYTVKVTHNSNGTKTGVPLKATWRFSGTYSGVSIDTITAQTSVDLDTINRITPTVLNSVSALTIDNTNPVLSLNWTVYDANYTHTLVIKNGPTSILTITGLTGSKGTNNKTYAFTVTQRTAILNAMSTIASFTATFVLTTYDGSTQVGDYSSITAKIQTTATNSAPTFTGFTFNDNLAKTVAVTKNNQLFVKSHSQLLVNCTAATAKNGATIARYTATIGTISKSSSTTSISYGSITSSGNLTLTVTATDSRGYTASKSMIITVIDYTDITIDSWMMRRVNEVEAQTQLTFAGKLSSVSVDGTAMNTLQSVQYRYKQTMATSWSSWYTIGDVEYTHGSFSYESASFITLDANFSYHIQIRATDKLSYHTIGLVLNKGTPLMAYRSQKVGINNADPQSALDVTGEIMMNGFNVMGFVQELGNTEDLDNIIDNGIFTQAVNANANTDRHYPVEKAGYLEVLGNPQGYKLHRYTVFDCSGVYIRYKNDSYWSSWKSINIL